MNDKNPPIKQKKIKLFQNIFAGSRGVTEEMNQPSSSFHLAWYWENVFVTQTGRLLQLATLINAETGPGMKCPILVLHFQQSDFSLRKPPHLNLLTTRELVASRMPSYAQPDYFFRQ